MLALHKYPQLVLVVLFSLLFCTAPKAADKNMTPIKFGSVAMDIPAEMHRRLTPLTQYLSKELNRPVSLRLSANMKSAIKELAQGNVDIAYLTPVAYIRSHEMADTKLVAKTITNKGDSFQLMIVVPDNSPIKTVAELAGKRFAFGDKAALLQRAVVVGADMPLDKLGSYNFIGHYDNIVRGVLHHDFDAGILKDTKYFQWKDRGIKLLYASPKLPPYNIAVSANVDPKLLQQIKNAFLRLDINKPADKRVIKSLDKKYDGFVATSNKEYDVVRKLVAPFN